MRIIVVSHFIIEDGSSVEFCLGMINCCLISSVYDGREGVTGFSYVGNSQPNLITGQSGGGGWFPVKALIHSFPFPFH